MGNIKFELLIPSSWLHKLRQHKSRGRRSSSSSSQLPQNSINKGKLSTASPTAAAARTTLSARSKQTAEHLPCSPVNTKASDTHFPADLRPEQRRQRRLHPRRRDAGNPCVAVASSVSCNFARTLTSRKPAGQGSHRRAAAASSGDLDFLHEEKENMMEPAESPEAASPAASATAGSDEEDELVVIKYASANPEEDFTESMVEMIVEHGICDSRGLEDLLACYLSLNSEEHHEVIIEVFERIWFAFADAELL